MVKIVRKQVWNGNKNKEMDWIRKFEDWIYSWAEKEKESVEETLRPQSLQSKRCQEGEAP